MCGVRGGEGEIKRRLGLLWSGGRGDYYVGSRTWAMAHGICMSGMLIRGHSVAWLMWLMWQGTASRVEEITVSWRCPLGLLIFIWLCRRFVSSFSFFVCCCAFLNFYSLFFGSLLLFCFHCGSRHVVVAVASVLLGNSIFCHGFWANFKWLTYMYMYPLYRICMYVCRSMCADSSGLPMNSFSPVTISCTICLDFIFILPHC